MDTPEHESKFVVCQCHNCNSGIEFDGSGFQKGETRTVECPHCKLETIIFVPVQTNASKPKQITTTPSKQNPPAANPPLGQKELFSKIVTNRTAAVFFAFTTFCLASILVWEHLPSRAQPVPADKISQTSLDTETAVNSTGKISAAFEGEILKVSKNRIVLSTFSMEPAYQMATTTEFRHRGFDATRGDPVLVAKKVQVGENKVPGRKIILLNYPTNLDPAVGQTISFRAARVGTSAYNGDVLELWNYQNQATAPAQ